MKGNSKNHTLLICHHCGASYHLFQYDDKGKLKEGCPMSRDNCICGSDNIEVKGKNRMKRKEFESGFILGDVRCSHCVTICDICVDQDLWGEFHPLKETLLRRVQDLHNENRPVACNGILTIEFKHVVREIK